MTVTSIALAALAAVAAQVTTQPGAPTAQIAPAPVQALILSTPGENVLRTGVEIQLRLEETLDSNDNTVRDGRQFRLSVANPVMLGDAIVIPAGSSATGEITEVKHKGMWGKSGRITARLLYVRVGDRRVRLTGTFDDKGVTGTAGVVGAIVLVPFAGFFVTGTSAKILAGSGVKAFLDEDLRIGVR